MIPIGITGRPRHGKDTLAKAMHCLRPRDTKVYSLASALKAYCRVMGWMADKDPGILQYVGTDLFRAHDPMIWVRVLKQTVDEDGADIALIPDVRFKNEAEWILENGGAIIRIVRTDGSPLAPDRDMLHPSELGIGDVEPDFVVLNREGYLHDMGKHATEVWRCLEGRYGSIR